MKKCDNNDKGNRLLKYAFPLTCFVISLGFLALAIYYSIVEAPESNALKGVGYGFFALFIAAAFFSYRHIARLNGRQAAMDVSGQTNTAATIENNTTRHM